MIYFQDENGFIYFMTNEQLTERIIKKWLMGCWFNLENHIATKLYKILTKP